MAKPVQSSRRTAGGQSAILETIDHDDDGKIVIKYWNHQGRSRKGVLDANDEVYAILEKWRETGVLERNERFRLADFSHEGFAKPPPQKLRVPEEKEPPKPKAMEPEEAEARRQKFGKPARLRAEAAQLRKYKDQPLVFIAVIVAVSVLTFFVLSL